MHRRLVGLLTLGGFLAGALLLYGIAVGAGLTADDWPFLTLVESAPLSVIFTPLVGRYLRPLVVLLYALNFRSFGTWPVPYHLTVVIIHGLNAWLLYRLLLALRLCREEALFAALLFLAFAGHSEAVTWVAGVADVILASFVLGSMTLLARGLDEETPAPWLVPGALLLPMGLLAKETAVVSPLLAAAVCCFVAARSRSPLRVLRRSALVLLWPSMAVASYLAIRALVFGGSLAAYSDLGTNSAFFGELRAFVLRVFLPAYSRVAVGWAHHLDLPILACGAAVLAAAAWRDRSRRPLFIFAIAAITISLAPALPLTISLSTTETERVVYIPTAFGALLTVIAAQSLIRVQGVRRAVLAILIGAHALVLQRFNRNWIEAGTAFSMMLRSFAEVAREHDPGPFGRFFILNLPDNVRGAYVFRRGFYEGLHFVDPELARRHDSIVAISSHTLWRAAEAVQSTQPTPTEFILDVAPNRFLQTSPPTTSFYEFPEWHQQGYRLRFATQVGHAVVLRTSEGRIEYVAELRGPGKPFGFVDAPVDGAVCSGTVTVGGWALDDESVSDVTIELTTGDNNVIPLGQATWEYNTRPDVAAVHPSYPHNDRAGWNLVIPCGRIPPPGARIHAVATDAVGNRTELGSRSVRVLGGPVTPR